MVQSRLPERKHHAAERESKHQQRPQDSRFAGGSRFRNGFALRRRTSRTPPERGCRAVSTGGGTPRQPVKPMQISPQERPGAPLPRARVVQPYPQRPEEHEGKANFLRLPWQATGVEPRRI